MQSHPEVSSFFLETTYYVLGFPFLVTQFSVLLHPISPIYIQTPVQTHHDQQRPETTGPSDGWSQLLVYDLLSQFTERNASSLPSGFPFLMSLWLQNLFLPVPQNAIYGYALNQPNAYRGSDLFPCHCYGAGPVLSQTELLPGLCAGSHCLSSLCACSRMCISCTLPYGSICYSHMEWAFIAWSMSKQCPLSLGISYSYLYS